MKKFIYLMLTSLLFITMGTAQNQKSQGAVISAAETDYDFGNIKEANGNVSHTFIIKNTGSKPLVLTRVVASCGCTTPEFDKEPIAPGREGKIKVTFNPAGRPGQFIKTIAVYSNGLDGAYILRVKGVVN
ncbi:hypothetical protein HR11_05450 [Porphyromonas macacae]|uniref:Protein of uncharacterized function (DUF1573) n=1 Tax=Porphyromonas macacae TaxID=28115 RepID=A0A0A2G8R3_9PORP|nr:DUF1573 domain-containing protein [Porphyromonas macacae]KGN75170.1 hypothetical protein HQ47_02160 [Porphyromonas macacae]KGN99673.1 hypothetical protein HR11_05450 [Porphyromonas macacae]SUB78561.1 Protein of uncharacterised function (DUF1573) [Porphyromonas macacae]SUB89745.1 Protein of uncharacterised function (DUF1573) [Porphyromonas macacae]